MIGYSITPSVNGNFERFPFQVKQILKDVKDFRSNNGANSHLSFIDKGVFVNGEKIATLFKDYGIGRLQGFYWSFDMIEYLSKFDGNLWYLKENENFYWMLEYEYKTTILKQEDVISRSFILSVLSYNQTVPKIKIAAKELYSNANKFFREFAKPLMNKWDLKDGTYIVLSVKNKRVFAQYGYLAKTQNLETTEDGVYLTGNSYFTMELPVILAFRDLKLFLNEKSKIYFSVIDNKSVFENDNCIYTVNNNFTKQ